MGRNAEGLGGALLRSLQGGEERQHGQQRSQRVTLTDSSLAPQHRVVPIQPSCEQRAGPAAEQPCDGVALWQEETAFRGGPRSPQPHQTPTKFIPFPKHTIKAGRAPPPARHVPPRRRNPTTGSSRARSPLVPTQAPWRSPGGMAPKHRTAPITAQSLTAARAMRGKERLDHGARNPATTRSGTCEL